MDDSREDRDRLFHVGPRRDIRTATYSTEEDEDLSPLARPYAQLERPRPTLKSHNFYDNHSSNPGTSRRFRGEHPYLMRSPINDDDPGAPPNNIPPLLPSEDEVSSGPRPLFSDEMIQKLRESLRQTAARYEDLSSTDWEYECDENTYSPPADGERMTYEEYLEEEEKTKQTIDEIIMVAQALRKKIEREEEMRRASYASPYAESPNARPPLLRAAAPSLSQPQSQIPSLLDLHVEPPEELFAPPNRFEPEYEVIDICWNCERRGHRYINCRYPKMRKFCYRCGKRGYDLVSCPVCQI